MTNVSQHLPAWLPALPQTAQLVTGIIVMVVMLHVILVGCAYAIMLERKLSSWMQDRVGPNRVGPYGLLQPIADGLKFLMKEEFVPTGADKVLFLLSPALLLVPAMITFAIVPWAGTLDLDSLPFGLAATLGLQGISVKMCGALVSIGMIYLLAIASLGVYGVALGGWSSNSKFSFIGGLRASAQMISYEIPMGLALLCIILTAGNLDPYGIIAAQSDRGLWNIVQQPVAAIIFYTCMLAEANRAPFDLAEAESELVGGYHTEYSSMRFAMFFLGEYFHLITGAAFFSLLFLGGWSVSPFGLWPDLPAQGGLLLVGAQFAVMMGKVLFMVAFAMAIRWTLPRFRFDQLMRLAWEGLIPTSLLVLLMTAAFVFMGWSAHIWIGSIGCVAVLYLISPLIPKQASPNHRIPMIGSRFSPLIDGTGAASRHPIAMSDDAIPDPRQGPLSIH
ncbi:MAG: NADH-quinone oxidoreductase subunit NuoH [Planctomycetes bacterium]|nr:NADH-quinone oxidoreductase subunit NuoH [Planctomycetota bacterium]